VDLHCHSDLAGPARLIYSKAQPKHHLAAWLDLMVLVAAYPEESWRSIVVRRNAGGNKPDPLELVARGATSEQRRTDALTALGVVVDLYRRGNREPIPLFSKLSRKLYDREAKAGDWKSMSWGEGTEDLHVLAFGAVDLHELKEVPVREDDPPGTQPGRASRFAEYLWSEVDRSAELREADACGNEADGADEPGAVEAAR
jgi:exodeoxyribonuclease V gamma subunit